MEPITNNDLTQGATQANVGPDMRLRGSADKFKTGTYKINTLMYPEDLMDDSTGNGGNQYGGTYVIFYINTHSDSYLVKSGASPVIDGNTPPRQNGELAGVKYTENVKTALVYLGTGAYLKGAGNVVGVGRALNADNPIVSMAANVATFAVGAAVGDQLIKELGGVTSDYKRLEAAIALHMPTELSTRYSANWEEDSFLASNIILDAGSNIEGVVKNALSSSDKSVDTNVMGTLRSGLTAAALNNVPGSGVISKMSGIASNPKKEQLFKQVDFRTFTFTYQFFPRSKTEANNVKDIIKMFKLHMHPEFKKDSSNFLYIYPSEFDIFYYQNGKENLNIHRHTSCVLTDMNVLYTPQGTFSSFEDGTPSQINVTLTFKELALLSKENIQDGF